MNKKIGRINSPDCLTAYRSPDSYIIGTPAYFEWLNCGVGNNSSEYGYGGGRGSNSGNGYELPITIMNTNTGGASTSPPINQNLPQTVANAPVPIPQVITIPNGNTKEPLIYHTLPANDLPLGEKLKNLYTDNPLLVLGAAAVVAYLVFGKK